MDAKALKCEVLSGNQLKILALITMTCDHAGRELFPELTILQIIGRLAFPIFAFMIAEGCRYTKNRRKYLFSMAGLGLLCQTVYYFAENSLYQCVLITFSLSIVLIYALDNASKRNSAASWTLCVLSFITAAFICVFLPEILTDTDFAVDYGFFGVLLPVFVYLGSDKLQQLCLACIPLIFISLELGEIQWFSLAAVAVLATYSGKRGKLKMKYLFYIYYPLHLTAIYAISNIL
ncbi:MAG: hypothetical protein IJX77_03445 [Ruminococcus sp.]|nr:hypothetical protein [Ruminococcus sp.]